MIEPANLEAPIVCPPILHGMRFKYDTDEAIVETSLKIEPTHMLDGLTMPVVQHPCGLVLFEMHRLPTQASPTVAKRNQARLMRQENVVVDCLYYNPVVGIYTLIDRKTLFFEHGSKSPANLVAEMLLSITKAGYLSYSVVLMATWYATREIILLTEHLGKSYWSAIENTMLVCRDSDGKGEIKRHLTPDELVFEANSLKQGKVVRLSTFPFEHRVRLFLISPTADEKNYMVTDQLSQNQADSAAMMYDVLHWRRS